jgi:hypothetical protein
VHVPDPVRRIFETRASITALSVAIAAGIMAPLSLGWRELEILGYIALAALVLEFWVDSARKGKQVDNLLSEREQAIDRAAVSEAQAEEIPELRAQVVQLEYESNNLRERLKSPAQSLEEVLAGLDVHLGYIGLVEKHRGLRGQGFGQWPVTSIQLREEIVLVGAHIDSDADRVSGEWVSLVDPAGTTLVAGQVVPASDNQLNAALQFEYFPEYLQDQLIQHSMLPPAGFTLRLLGLSFPVYSMMNDGQITQVRDALGEATRVIGEVLSGPPERQGLTEGSEENS